MNRIPPRYQLPLVAGVSLVVVLVVVGAVLIAGRLGPTPTPGTSVASASPSGPIDAAAPDDAAKAFFVAYGQASLTDDPTILLPLVTSDRAFSTLPGVDVLW